jgi:hypothetical protein
MPLRAQVQDCPLNATAWIADFQDCVAANRQRFSKRSAASSNVRASRSRETSASSYMASEGPPETVRQVLLLLIREVVKPRNSIVTSPSRLGRSHDSVALAGG